MRISPKIRNRVGATGLAIFTLVAAPLAFGLTPGQRAALLAFAGGGGITAPLGPTTPDANAVAVVPSATANFAKETGGNLAQIVANTAASIPAGSAIIGKVGIDQTTPGTTNGVQVSGALPAGSNLLGKVGIDQTTPGTTNLVALPANQSVNVAQVGGTNTVNGGVAGVQAVGGNVANGVTATANPVPVGGVFTTTPATLTTGQTATAQFTAAQNFKTDVTTVGGAPPATTGPAVAANSIPFTIGPSLLGSYCMGANTGTMAAGLAGGAPVYSFRYGGANLAIVRKVIIEADDISTAFVAGAAKFDMIAARTFSASDTGGTGATLTGNNGKLRTSFATTAISDLRISSTATLTAGTRTLDAQPLASVEFPVPTSIDAALLPTTNLYQATIGESPFILANNEGFVIQATVPGTGTWVFSVRACWDEVAAF